MGGGYVDFTGISLINILGGSGNEETVTSKNYGTYGSVLNKTALVVLSWVVEGILQGLAFGIYVVVFSF